jgi:hypothetical protein
MFVYCLLLGFDISRIWRLVLEKSSERKRKKKAGILLLRNGLHEPQFLCGSLYWVDVDFHGEILCRGH